MKKILNALKLITYVFHVDSKSSQWFLGLKWRRIVFDSTSFTQWEPLCLKLSRMMEIPAVRWCLPKWWGGNADSLCKQNPQLQSTALFMSGDQVGFVALCVCRLCWLAAISYSMHAHRYTGMQASAYTDTQSNNVRCWRLPERAGWCAINLKVLNSEVRWQL